MNEQKQYEKLVKDKGLGLGVHIFQGNNHLKSISGTDLFGADWARGTVTGNNSVQSLFSKVAWVYTAIRTRKSYMRQIDTAFYKNGERLTDKIVSGIPLSDLPRIDQAIELHGGAYYIKEDTIGNGIVFDWLDPQYVNPNVTTAYRGGYKEYHYGNVSNNKGENLTIPEERLLIIQEKGMSESSHMATAGNAISASGSILKGIAQTFEAFYNSNGLPLIAVIVSEETTQEQADTIASRFRTLFSGKQTSDNKVVGLAGDIKIEKISFSPDELNNTEMSEQEIKTVLGAFEIHPSLVLTSANRAETEYRIKTLLITLDARLNLITGIIENDKDWIRSTSNVTIDTDITKHPIFQAENLEQASAISALTGTPILTVNEGRAKMGLEPVQNGDTLQGFQEEPVDELLRLAKEEKTEQTKAWKDEASVFNRWLKRRENPNIEDFKAVHLTHLDKVKVFADYIVVDTQYSVGGGVESTDSFPVEIKLSQQEENDMFLLPERDELEEQKAIEILAALERQLDILLPEDATEQQIEDAVDNVDETSDELKAIILALLLASSKYGVDSGLAQIEETIDQLIIDGLISEATLERVNIAIDQINNTTRDAIIKAIAIGGGILAIRALLKPTKERAELIAKNEGAEGFGDGITIVGDTAQSVEGYEWYTMRDDLVCVICRPMHGERREVNDSYYDESGSPIYIPAHVGCRCSEKLIENITEGL